MSFDMNNNSSRNETEDETEEEEEEEEEDEPVFKFSTITISTGLRKTNDSDKNIPADFSCIAVHEKFLVIGRTTGEILITDHLGNTIPQYQIRAVKICFREKKIMKILFFFWCNNSIHIQ